jgi:Domain of unknown function DUF1829/Domain of unknown function DUF1828
MTDVKEIEHLVERYRSWLKDKTTLKSVHSDWIQITTPFLDRHNDAIQIYVKAENGGYRLTDDGHTIRDLELSGCTLNTPKRKSLLEIAVRGFAVDSTDDVLSVRTTAENFAVRKHALIQCIVALNDLFYTASATVRSLFREDVENWLNIANIRFLGNVQFTGKTGYTHQFDFAIPPSKNAPERILKAINNPNKEATESLIFSWLDTRESRPSNSVAVAMLNDNDRDIQGSVIDAMHHYKIETTRWSEREISRARLAA